MSRLDEDPATPEELAELLTEPASEEDRELIEYGAALLNLPPAVQQALDLSLDEFGPAQREDLPGETDADRWEGLLLDALKRTLGVFLTPDEIKQAITDLGTCDFDAVIQHLNNVRDQAGPVLYGPHGTKRSP